MHDRAGNSRLHADPVELDGRLIAGPLRRIRKARNGLDGGLLPGRLEALALRYQPARVLLFRVAVRARVERALEVLTDGVPEHREQAPRRRSLQSAGVLCQSDVPDEMQ